MTFSLRKVKQMRFDRSAIACNQAHPPAHRGAIRTLRIGSGAAKRVTNMSIPGGCHTPEVGVLALILPPNRCSAKRRTRTPVGTHAYGALLTRSDTECDRQTKLAALVAQGHTTPLEAWRGERRSTVNKTDNPGMSSLAADDPLLTPEEVSVMLGGVPPATLKRWRTQRTGPVVLHIGRHVRYRRSAVEVWLQEKDREAAAWMAL